MNEGFGIPVLEAQLYKLPLIIRDLEINRELFPNAKFFKSTFELADLLEEIKPISKNEIIERKKTLANISQFNLINKSYIEHRLSHLKIKSRFWLVNFENNFLGGIFTNDFNRYPMSKLMYKFINDYEIRLSKLSKFKLNNYYVRNTK